MKIRVNYALPVRRVRLWLTCKHLMKSVLLIFIALVTMLVGLLYPFLFDPSPRFPLWAIYAWGLVVVTQGVWYISRGCIHLVDGWKDRPQWCSKCSKRLKFSFNADSKHSGICCECMGH